MAQGSHRHSAAEADPVRDLAAQGETGQAASTRLSRLIAELAPHDLSATQIPQMRAELAQARREAEAGVARILDAAEAILATPAAGDLDSPVSAQAAGILEACGFEDLVGQRLNKLDQHLADIEQRLARLSARAGIADAEHEESAAEARRRRLILNGPALDLAASGQAEIDRLFDQT